MRGKSPSRNFDDDFDDEVQEKKPSGEKSPKKEKPLKQEKPPKEKNKIFARPKKHGESESDEKPGKRPLFSRRRGSKSPPPRPETPEFLKDGCRSPCSLPSRQDTPEHSSILKHECHSPCCLKAPPPRPEPPVISQNTSRSSQNLPPPKEKQPAYKKGSSPKPTSAVKLDSRQSKSAEKPAYSISECNSPCSLPSRQESTKTSEECPRRSRPASNEKQEPTECRSPCSLYNRQRSSTDATSNRPSRKSSLHHRDSEHSSRSKTRLPYDDKIRKNFFNH